MSNYVKTTNFLRKDSLPDTDNDKIIRGSEFDTEFNNIVTAVASKANTVSPEFTGVPTAPTASAGTSTTQIATTAFVAQNAILTGMIVMWSGSVATIPSGYVLCDGNNSTPDLTDKFIMGAGSTYNPDDTGGSADAIVPAHTHTGTTDSAGNHNHSLPHYLVQAVSGTGDIDRDNEYQQWKALSGQSTGSNGNHTHTFTTNETGESVTGKNIPPYFALAFIMKT
jgi:hypothetical protein